MTRSRYALVCLLLVSLSLYPGVDSLPVLAAQVVNLSEDAAHDLSSKSETRRATPDEPAITISGLCGNSLNSKAAVSNCKTVITQSEFQRIIDSIDPNMPAHGRREFAERYSDALVMASKAEQMGLDKQAIYKEQMKLARIQILSQDLKKLIQEKASQIPDSDIDDYYRNNIARFEKAEVERIFVPKAQHAPLSSEVRLSDADQQKHSEESGQAMKNEAASLYKRAVAGEEFTELQADAYRIAGINGAMPATSMLIRRVSLPPSQVSIMSLKSGDISSVMADPNGYVIYKIKAKYVLPVNQVREEIKEILRSQRFQDKMREIEDSATPSLDENYFAH
jgi:PPIC-type PPIASE domain